ncbi:MAG: molybdopterin-dependent oxidoreductase [Singulisphaera sp.]
MSDRGGVTPGAGMSRRDWIRVAAGASAVGGLAGPWSDRLRRARAEEGGARPTLIVRSSQPLDLETPVEVFDEFLTPNDLFFVRSHFGAPAVALGPWRLEIRGLVGRPLTLGLDDLAAMEQVAAPAVLQCSGNGRAYFTPTIPGVGWDRGAVGNAEWAGVRLADLLRRAGLELDEGHVHLGGRRASSIKTPSYLAEHSLRALDPNTLVATRMGRRAAAPPRRANPPGRAGLGRQPLDQVAADGHGRPGGGPGFYQQTGYRMPKVRRRWASEAHRLGPGDDYARQVAHRAADGRPPGGRPDRGAGWPGPARGT